MPPANLAPPVEGSPLPFAPFEMDEAFKDLAALMSSKRPPLAMIGAGASIRSGYPSWDGLLERLEAAAGPTATAAPWKATLKELNDASWTAEVHCRSINRRAFARLIEDEFGPKTVEEPHLTLADMPFRHFLTTNYDPCIELALQRRNEAAQVVNWSERELLSDFLIRLGDPDARRSVVHLHGRYDQPMDVILTESSYVERYISSDDARRKLLAIFMTHPVVFVGFSMNDPDFANLMREVTARLTVKPPRHFALLGYKKLEEREAYRARMIGKFGVRPVFFSRVAEEGGDEYANLLLLLDALRGKTGRTMKDVAPRSDAMAASAASFDPLDPQKGRWSGRSETASRRMRVELVGAKGRWVTFTLVVETTDGSPLTGPVHFHLHPSFADARRLVAAQGPQARLELTSYGAFTAGAEADNGDRLELDLAVQPDLPLDWRRR